MAFFRQTAHSLHTCTQACFWLFLFMQPIPIRQAIILKEWKKHKSHHIVANFNGFIKAPWCAALQKKTFVCVPIWRGQFLSRTAATASRYTTAIKVPSGFYTLFMHVLRYKIMVVKRFWISIYTYWCQKATAHINCAQLERLNCSLFSWTQVTPHTHQNQNQINGFTFWVLNKFARNILVKE